MTFDRGGNVVPFDLGRWEDDGGPAVDPPEDPHTVWLQKLNRVKTTVNQWWPAHWPLFEACLSAYCSLLLKGVTQGVGVILVGDSGAGKGTILDAFQGVTTADGTELTVWRDKFTPASLLSGFAGEKTTKETVNDRALFRAVKHRVLVVGDLGPILQGGQKGNDSLYSLMPPWFDGNGLQFDTGTHGVIGAKGDFSFVMLGGKTPFDMPTWRSMSTLGLRFLFLRVPKLDDAEKVRPQDYDRAKGEIRAAVQDFLGWVFTHHPTRTMEWPEVSPEHEQRFADYASIMAAGQTVSDYGREREVGRVIRPTPNHVWQRSIIVCAGRAVLYQRRAIDESDLNLAKRFVRTSAPGQRGRVLLALSEGYCEAKQIEGVTKLAYGTVVNTLTELRELGVVTLLGTRPAEGRGQPTKLWTIAPEAVDPEREAMRAEDDDV